VFRKAEVLSSKKHAKLKLAQADSYGFASKLLTVPILYSEMSDIAREYPLLFPKGQDFPIALMGAEVDVNAYVTAEGKWLASYIPARIMAYPFALTAVPNKPNEMALVIDMAADTVGTDIGMPLFETDGTPAAPLKARLDVLRKMKEQEVVTARMVRHIREAGLLVERGIRISQSSSDDRQIAGLEFVNEKALNALSHEDFAKLRDGGALPLIYAHLLSVSNLRQGVIAGKYVDRNKPEIGVSMVDVDQFLAQSGTQHASGSKTQVGKSPDLSLLSDEGDFDLSDLSAFTKKQDLH
jgi:hypothetical protein